MDNTTNIKNAYRIKISRNRTHVTTYQNLQLWTTKPMKEDKQKKIKPTIPSNYTDHNYYLRMKQRKDAIREICYNSFGLPNVMMLTLTFDKPTTELEAAHIQFKRFIQRINNHYDGFRYTATFSRQTKGNWHYHVICNFSNRFKNHELKALWGNGITYITYLHTNHEMINAIDYLVNNMVESAGETKGKRGYLFSKNTERDIVVDSWKESDAEDFVKVFEKVEKAPRHILYETKNHLGIQGETVDEETGEIFQVSIPERELNPILEQAGYESWDTTYTHLKSSAEFKDKFSELKPATPAPKKFKRTVSKK